MAGFEWAEYLVGAGAAYAIIRFAPALYRRRRRVLPGARLFPQFGGLLAGAAIFASVKCALWYIEGVRWLAPLLLTTLSTLFVAGLLTLAIVVGPFLRNVFCFPLFRRKKEAPFGVSFQLWHWMLGGEA
ncbi:MAG: hypothetical protein LBR44_03760 [Clostridiales Family XIII bacterium]|jgi:hypothetical protein|nr:hypothetical protein [Clostridiales Family XIII bacterium]